MKSTSSAPGKKKLRRPSRPKIGWKTRLQGLRNDLPVETLPIGCKNSRSMALVNRGGNKMPSALLEIEYGGLNFINKLKFYLDF